MRIDGAWRSITSSSYGSRVLLEWAATFGAQGATVIPSDAACAVAARMTVIHSSSSSGVLTLAVGKEPITPFRQAAITSSGPETRNIGAAISGRRSLAASCGSRDIGLQLVDIRFEAEQQAAHGL